MVNIQYDSYVVKTHSVIQIAIYFKNEVEDNANITNVYSSKLYVIQGAAAKLHPPTGCGSYHKKCIK